MITDTDLAALVSATGTRIQKPEGTRVYREVGTVIEVAEIAAAFDAIPKWYA